MMHIPSLQSPLGEKGDRGGRGEKGERRRVDSDKNEEAEELVGSSNVKEVSSSHMI